MQGNLGTAGLAASGNLTGIRDLHTVVCRAWEGAGTEASAPKSVPKERQQGQW